MRRMRIRTESVEGEEDKIIPPLVLEAGFFIEENGTPAMEEHNSLMPGAVILKVDENRGQVVFFFPWDVGIHREIPVGLFGIAEDFKKAGDIQGFFFQSLAKGGLGFGYFFPGGVQMPVAQAVDAGIHFKKISFDR